MISMWQGSSEKGSLWSRSSIWRATLCAWDPAATRCLRTIREYAEILSRLWGGEVSQLTGAAGNMDPERGPQDAAYAEECGQALADSLAGMSFTKVKGKGLVR